MKNQKPTKGRPLPPITLTAGDGELVSAKPKIVTLGEILDTTKLEPLDFSKMEMVAAPTAIDRTTVVENFTPRFDPAIARLVAEADAFAAKRREEDQRVVDAAIFAVTDAYKKRRDAAVKGWETRRRNAIFDNASAKIDAAISAHPTLTDEEFAELETRYRATVRRDHIRNMQSVVDAEESRQQAEDARAEYFASDRFLIVTPNPPTLFERIAVRLLKIVGVK